MDAIPCCFVKRRKNDRYFLSRQKDINMGIKGNALYSVNMGVSFEERSMNFAFMIGNQRLLFVIGLHRAGDVAQLKDMY
jgi:hypothetical protein